MILLLIRFVSFLYPMPAEERFFFDYASRFTNFQLDLAADFSELVDTVSLSFIYSF